MTKARYWFRKSPSSMPRESGLSALSHKQRNKGQEFKRCPSPGHSHKSLEPLCIFSQVFPPWLSLFLSELEWDGAGEGVEKNGNAKAGLLLTSAFRDWGLKIVHSDSKEEDIGPTHGIADNGRRFRDHLGCQTKWPCPGAGADPEQSVPTAEGLFACGLVYLPVTTHLHSAFIYISSSQTFL